MKQITTFLTTFFLILSAHPVRGQEYRYPLGNSPERAVEFTVGRGEVIIEGHESDELIIRNLDYEAPPERAQGLRAIYNSAVDNTGIGLFVEEEDGILTITPASASRGEYSILVPDRVRLKVEEVDFGNGNYEIHNHKGEIEVSSRSGNIKMVDVTGPIIADNTSGNVEILFSGLSQQNPTSISLISGFIDVTLPKDTPVNFRLSSFSGEIYTDLDIDLYGTGNVEPEELENSEELEGMSFDNLPVLDARHYLPGRQIEGTLNGGGIEMSLKTLSGNIYLRRE